MEIIIFAVGVFTGYVLLNNDRRSQFMKCFSKNEAPAQPNNEHHTN